MALDVRNIYSIMAGADAGNVGGGGFNPYTTATLPSDLATTTGTNASPTVSGAYAFTALDQTAAPWIYIKSGTNWIQGFYKVTGVSGGVATINAAIGAAVIWDATTQRWTPSTVQGCCTQATPGGNATYGVDYSQSLARVQISTTATNTAGVITGGGLVFGTNLLGNICQVVAGTSATQGWYEITADVAGTSLTLDRDPGGTTNISINIGGALSLNSATANRTDDIVFELGSGTNGTGASIFFLKGALTQGGTVAIAAAGGTQTPVRIVGYGSVRGDTPTGATKPSIAHATFQFTLGPNWDEYNVTRTGAVNSASGMLVQGQFSKQVNCKLVQSTTTAARPAVFGGSEALTFNCEMISYRGPAYSSNAAPNSVKACYIHDSDVGILSSGSATENVFNWNVIESCVTTAIQISAAQTRRTLIENNTLFGSINKMGTGVLIATTARHVSLYNNIISYFVTGIVHPDVQTECTGDYNCFYGNTVDVAATAGGASDSTRWQKGPHDVATNPAFTNVTQVTSSVSVILSSNRIQDAAKNWTTLGVVANATPGIGYTDYVYYSAGTSGTKGIYAITAITTVTNPNDTLTLDQINAANATADHVIQIALGHNFLPTGAL